MPDTFRDWLEENVGTVTEADLNFAPLTADQVREAARLITALEGPGAAPSDKDIADFETFASSIGIVDPDVFLALLKVRAWVLREPFHMVQVG